MQGEMREAKDIYVEVARQEGEWFGDDGAFRLTFGGVRMSLAVVSSCRA